jgi:hypothetical protein
MAYNQHPHIFIGGDMNKLKRQISYRKFNRILRKFDSSPCRAYRYQPRKYEPEASLGAYVNGDYCYVVFLVNRGQDKMERVYMRYFVGDGNRADAFAYVLGYNERF